MFVPEADGANRAMLPPLFAEQRRLAMGGCHRGFCGMAAGKHLSAARMQWIVCMGVAGSGKSSLGALIASRLMLPFIEGDDFHSEDSKRKMRAGVALDDADRAEWLDVLGRE